MPRDGGPDLAIFIPGLRPGGAQRTMLDLAAGFRSRGYGVELLVTTVQGPYAAEVPEGVTLRCFDTAHLLGRHTAGKSRPVGPWLLTLTQETNVNRDVRHDGGRPRAEQQDPVCGSLIPSASPHQCVYNGYPYQFCSGECLTRFLAAPEGYTNDA